MVQSPDPPRSAEPDPESEEGLQKRYERMTAPRTQGDNVPPALVLAAVVVVIAVAVLVSMYSSGKPPPVEYAAVPQDVIHVEVEISKAKSFDRGYKIVTPEWIVVSDERTVQQPATRGYGMTKADLVRSENLAAVCRMATKSGKPVTFRGQQIQNLMLDGKPVLVASSIIYEEQAITLSAND